MFQRLASWSSSASLATAALATRSRGESTTTTTTSKTSGSSAPQADAATQPPTMATFPYHRPSDASMDSGLGSLTPLDKLHFDSASLFSVGDCDDDNDGEQVILLEAFPTLPPAENATEAASGNSWKVLARSALTVAQGRLNRTGSVLSLRNGGSEVPKTILSLDGAQLTEDPESAEQDVPTPPPKEDESRFRRLSGKATDQPLEFRLPWLGLGLQPDDRRRLRKAVLALSNDRDTFSETLAPDYDYLANPASYQPLVALLHEEDAALSKMKAQLVSQRLTEAQFYANYLYRVSLAVTHAKLEAGLPGAMMPLLRSVTAPPRSASTPDRALLSTSPATTAADMTRPRTSSTPLSPSISSSFAPPLRPLIPILPLEGLAADGPIDTDLEALQDEAADGGPLVLHVAGGHSAVDWCHLPDDHPHHDDEEVDNCGKEHDQADRDLERLAELDVDSFYEMLEAVIAAEPPLSGELAASIIAPSAGADLL